MFGRASEFNSLSSRIIVAEIFLRKSTQNIVSLRGRFTHFAKKHTPLVTPLSTILLFVFPVSLFRESSFQYPVDDRLSSFKKKKGKNSQIRIRGTLR